MYNDIDCKVYFSDYLSIEGIEFKNDAVTKEKIRREGLSQVANIVFTFGSVVGVISYFCPGDKPFEKKCYNICNTSYVSWYNTTFCN